MKEKELKQLQLNKRNAKKTLKLKIMVKQEVFGEEEFINEYYKQLKTSQDKQNFNLNINISRNYSVQCSSTHGSLIILTKDDLFKKILSRMKLYDIQDLVDRIDNRLKNNENKVDKIRNSMIPFKNFYISESQLDPETKQTLKFKITRPKSSLNYSQSPPAHEFVQNNADQSLSFLKRNLSDFNGISTSNTLRKSDIPVTQNVNSSNRLSIKITNNESFSEKMSQINKVISQIEPNKSQSAFFGSAIPKYSFLNTSRNQNESICFQEKENSLLSPNLSFIKSPIIRPPSSSVACTMKKTFSVYSKRNSHINSFNSLEQQQNESVNQQNIPYSKDFVNEGLASGETSKIFYNDKSKLFNDEKQKNFKIFDSFNLKKRFSVFEKSTMETSINNFTEQIKSPRMKLQLGITKNNNIDNHKSLNINKNQEKKLIQLENKLNEKMKDEKPEKRIDFIEFVSQNELGGKYDKVVSERNGQSATYSGLNLKVLETVKQKKSKIELIQPIFHRGYEDNFKKEIIKLHNKNVKYNYLSDLKEHNSAKGLHKFSHILQEIDKQKKQKINKNINKDSFNNASNNNNISNTNNNISSNNNISNNNNSQNNNIQSNNNISSNFNILNQDTSNYNNFFNQNNSSSLNNTLHQNKGSIYKQLQINTNSNKLLRKKSNSSYLKANRDTFQNNTSQVSETTILSPTLQPTTPGLSMNTNPFINTSGLVNPIMSSRTVSQSVQPSPILSPNSKNLKITLDSLSKLVDNKQCYSSRGFIGIPTPRIKSQSVKSIINNQQPPKYLQTNFSSLLKSQKDKKEGSQENIFKSSVIIVHKKSRQQSSSIQQSMIS